jgi:hypothetical protein
MVEDVTWRTASDRKEHTHTLLNEVQYIQFSFFLWLYADDAFYGFGLQKHCRGQH